ncbi:hypothetical protein GQX74_014312 [Glossina fuscipes]|nr:hypothetical protein GQX74_014312 [Glossina fuscipes]
MKTRRKIVNTAAFWAAVAAVALFIVELLRDGGVVADMRVESTAIRAAAFVVTRILTLLFALWGALVGPARRLFEIGLANLRVAAVFWGELFAELAVKDCRFVGVKLRLTPVPERVKDFLGVLSTELYSLHSEGKEVELLSFMVKSSNVVAMLWQSSATSDWMLATLIMESSNSSINEGGLILSNIKLQLDIILSALPDKCGAVVRFCGTASLLSLDSDSIFNVLSVSVQASKELGCVKPMYNSVSCCSISRKFIDISAIPVSSFVVAESLLAVPDFCLRSAALCECFRELLLPGPPVVILTAGPTKLEPTVKLDRPEATEKLHGLSSTPYLLISSLTDFFIPSLIHCCKISKLLRAAPLSDALEDMSSERFNERLVAGTCISVDGATNGRLNIPYPASSLDTPVEKHADDPTTDPTLCLGDWGMLWVGESGISEGEITPLASRLNSLTTELLSSIGPTSSSASESRELRLENIKGTESTSTSTSTSTSASSVKLMESSKSGVTTGTFSLLFDDNFCCASDLEIFTTFGTFSASIAMTASNLKENLPLGKRTKGQDCSDRIKVLRCSRITNCIILTLVVAKGRSTHLFCST